MKIIPLSLKFTQNPNTGFETNLSTYSTIVIFWKKGGLKKENQQFGIRQYNDSKT